MSKKEKIDKVRKLLALAENNSSEGESDAALKMAEKLMSLFNVSHEDIKKSELDEEFGKLGTNSYDAERYNWQALLMSACCSAFDCVMLCHTVSRKKAYSLYGREGNIVTAIEFFEWLRERTKKEAKEKFPHRQIKARNDYCMGVAVGLGQKVSELRKQKQTGLDLYEEAQKYGESIYGIPNKKSIGARDSAGFSSGVKTGKDICLNRQMNNKSVKYIS